MRKEKILDLARGYWGRSKNCNVLARTRVEKGLGYAYRDRKVNKRKSRELWVQQINAGAREYGVSYSQLVSGLQRGGVDVNRKVMADLARNEPVSFKVLVDISRLFF